MLNKLDGVGPVDNRPSPNKLHNFVQKRKKKRKKVTQKFVLDPAKKTKKKKYPLTHGIGANYPHWSRDSVSTV